ncbi:MAG: glycine cleavage system aminomethyltransferase T, aminomethyltransferase [Chloroflexi bacterium CSP1-4]|nr:MAG: glycine cleavage system aminomethyltransferase T, aminomethyltransferase [Chloroflexi bacterium CSP1-4]
MRRTSLYGRHVAAGARLIEFGGWEMPVQYTGILDEHRAVRERAGLFDLSHMGELWVHGPEAGAALAYALVTDPPRLGVGRAHYAMITGEDGGIIDDLIVYRTAETRFLVVPNAGNREAVTVALGERVEGFDATLDDASLVTALVAVQGPRAAGILAPLTDVDIGSLRYYAIARGSAAGVPTWVARTGYTGEDGFELFVAWDAAPAVWDALIEGGAAAGLVPVGLGARDTLRLEAGMPLYGNDLDRATNPFEAGLGRVVKFDKPADFVGRAALERVAARGPGRRLAGLIVRGRGIARHGYPVYRPGDDEPCGVITSGTVSPTLGVPIALAFLPPDEVGPGTIFECGVRDARVAAEIVPLPFYQRPT